MAISPDYPSPVTVNGFACKNCTDVDYAKKHIDPAHPKDGPFGINAKEHKTGVQDGPAERGPPIVFGGQLAAQFGNSTFTESRPPSEDRRRVNLFA